MVLDVANCSVESGVTTLINFIFLFVADSKI